MIDKVSNQTNHTNQNQYKPMKKLNVFLLLLGLGCMPLQAQDIRSQLRQIANDLAKQIETKGKKRVVIASFLDLKNQETELGRYMSDKFSIGMASSSLEITDRSQLAQLLRDNKLAADRILDPKTIPRLGQITGAEVIITGNYTALDNSVDITVKAIDLERGLRLAVAEGAIPRTSEINKLLNEVGDITGPGNENDEDEKKTKDPDKGCTANHTGTYCFQNNTKMDIKIQTNGADFTIHPGQTECLPGIQVYNTGEYTYTLYIYRNAKESVYETRQIVVTECQKKTFVVR